MAVTHINFNDQTTHGRQLRRVLNQGEESYEGLKDLLATLATMIDGNGSDAAHFTYVTEKFGFGTNANAKAAWDELQSYYSKISGDGQVTNVNAAMLQVWNKFR